MPAPGAGCRPPGATREAGKDRHVSRRTAVPAQIVTPRCDQRPTPAAPAHLLEPCEIRAFIQGAKSGLADGLLAGTPGPGQGGDNRGQSRTARPCRGRGLGGRRNVNLVSQELGAWLRQQRQSRSWNVPEMTRRLRHAARASGDNLPANECLFTMIRRWERGETGVSERYRLHYGKAFGITPEQFGPAEPAPAAAAPGRLAAPRRRRACRSRWQCPGRGGGAVRRAATWCHRPALVTRRRLPLGPGARFGWFRDRARGADGGTRGRRAR